MSQVNGKHRDNRDPEDDDVEAKLLHNGAKFNEKEKSDYKEKNEDENEVDMSVAIEKVMRDMPMTEDTTCGFWIFKARFLQRFANQFVYVGLYGFVGCMIAMTYAYFNGTITTIEKRFKIPSRNTGIISVGNDISQLFVSAALSYYAGKGHRPRWIGFGLLTIIAFCLLTALPHFLYGPGEDALMLTEEFGALRDENATMEALEEQRSKLLCRNRGNSLQCDEGEGNLAPQVVLFLAQVISGIGGSLYFTLGVSYMDDNTKKAKTPALLSISYFLRMLGPALGYALASFCLRVYIAPSLTPVIGEKDPRWLGAWWVGWLLIGGILTVAGFFLTMFPKELPKTAARRIVESERKKLKGEEEKVVVVEKASMRDMMKTFKSLIHNPTMMCNNLSSIFYFIGYTPYWIFSPKYIEIQYRQSAATSSLVTGTIALAFSALGVLLSGFVISKYKPKARYMAAWNVAVGFLTVAGIISYSFIGCPGNENSVIVNIHDSSSLTPTCNSNCQCDFVRYSPICGEDGMTYISPCHAGCKKEHVSSKGQKTFYDCGCIPANNSTSGLPIFERLTAQSGSTDSIFLDATNDSLALSTTTSATSYPDIFLGGQAITGSCPVDCFKYFVGFIAVMCCMKFIGASGRTTNFLVSVRCVPEKDKTAAMGFGLMLVSMFAFIPSPIFFGWLIDKLCLVWGKTCTNKGNCWLYDPESLRYTLNMTASIFVIIGSVFDLAVWYYVKDLKIFEEEVKDVELEVVQHEEDANPERKAET